jgi:hypothetical protein
MEEKKHNIKLADSLKKIGLIILLTLVILYFILAFNFIIS